MEGDKNTKKDLKGVCTVFPSLFSSPLQFKQMFKCTKHESFHPVYTCSIVRSLQGVYFYLLANTQPCVLFTQQ